ncbi:MAG: GTP cyclohydrolase I FolE [Actinomycetota bacterium]
MTNWNPRVVVDASEALSEEPDRATSSVDRPRVEAAVRELLAAIGDDPTREGVLETPRRVAEAYADLFAGLSIDAVAVVEPLPDERGTGLILVRDIQFASICEHHLLPFTGRAAVGYVPGADGRITGLSKLARVVEVLARRPQVQERLVRQVADALETALAPSAVAVVIEAEHMCMTIRGVRKPGSTVTTTEFRGSFLEDASARAEFLTLARNGG